MSGEGEKVCCFAAGRELAAVFGERKAAYASVMIMWGFDLFCG